jgi:hypothetical protein
MKYYVDKSDLSLQLFDKYRHNKWKLKRGGLVIFDD